MDQIIPDRRIGRRDGYTERMEITALEHHGYPLVVSPGKHGVAMWNEPWYIPSYQTDTVQDTAFGVGLLRPDGVSGSRRLHWNVEKQKAN